MKDLEDYFNAARKTEPPQSLQEIKNIINRTEQPQSFSNIDQLFYKRKSFIYLSLTISTMLLTLIISLIAFQDPKSSDQEVFIPDSQQRLVRLVKGITIDSTSSAIRLSPVGRKTVYLSKDSVIAVQKAVESIPLHLRSTLQLPNETLILLGIIITDFNIRYEGNVKGSGFVSFYVNATHHSTSVEDGQRKGVKEYDFYPWFLTDENGKQRVRYQFNNEPPLKMTNEFFSNTMDQLIPIKVASPDGGNVIFWFSQTDALMRILESAASVPIDSGPKENEDTSASSLEIQLYPTITKGEVNVTLKTLKKQQLEISVLNGSGEVIQVPVKNQTLDEGDHYFQMDLSRFEKGLYFVRVQSQPGITTVHRIFKN
jgi:hypothetical protein